MKRRKILIRKMFLLFLLTTTELTPIMAQSQTWKVDPVHSSVGFMVEHMVISEVTGNFHEFSGEVTLSSDDFTTAQIEGRVKVNSIDTGIDQRDSHLKSEDFFYAEKYPKMSFKSRSVEKTGKDTYRITGDLTIRGVTKSVIFDAKYGGSVTAFGTQRMGWQASTTINRFDYGLNWKKTIETGGLIAGDTVEVDIKVELIKQL